MVKNWKITLGEGVGSVSWATDVEVESTLRALLDNVNVLAPGEVFSIVRLPDAE